MREPVTVMASSVSPPVSAGSAAGPVAGAAACAMSCGCSCAVAFAATSDVSASNVTLAGPNARLTAIPTRPFAQAALRSFVIMNPPFEEIYSYASIAAPALTAHLMRQMAACADASLRRKAYTRRVAGIY
jgi:hypothetical protein